jgi:hypothetical protein
METTDEKSQLAVKRGKHNTHIGELSELGVGRSHAQVLTYFGCESWAGVAREDEGVAHLEKTAGRKVLLVEEVGLTFYSRISLWRWSKRVGWSRMVLT